MLEESIASSPSKSNTSIRNVRLLRRTKRKQVDSEKDDFDLQNILTDFYFDAESNLTNSKPLDSTFSIADTTSVVNNYKLFQLEKSYVTADNVVATTSRKLKSTVVETQGFLTCEQLAENIPTKSDFLWKTNATQINTSFTITESELITCCNQAENIFRNISPSIKERSPSKDDMSLVNSILEDFSQSPLAKNQINNNMSWQCTPEYRLRRKPNKTYSRKFLNKTRADLSKRFENQSSSISDEEHDNISNCSSLSVQEDIGAVENLSSALVSTSDTSQRLCENLLNLSVHFTQNDQNITCLDNREQNQLNDTYSSVDDLVPASRVPNLINEIINLRVNLRTLKDTNNSLNDFYGFPYYTNLVQENSNNIDQTVSDPSEITLSSNQIHKEAANLKGNELFTLNISHIEYKMYYFFTKCIGLT